MSTWRLSLVLMAAVVLSACAVGPNYRRPVVATPQAFRFADAEAKNLADTAWWQRFNDPVLNELIDTALTQNKDIRIAAARVQQFKAILMGGRSGYFPQINYSALAGRSRTDIQSVAPAFNALLDASWEIDLWGRVRRENEAARANLFASEQARRGVVLTLVAAVAQSYIDLRVLDKQLEMAHQTLAARTEAVDLFAQRSKSGYVSDLETSQVHVGYETIAAAIPQLESAIARQENALCILLGRNPSPIPRGASLDALAIPGVPAGLPSDLLTRRPDITQAEHLLIAANAEVGAARARYFPTISLTGLFGGISAQLSELLKVPSRSWSADGQIAGPLFNGGRMVGLNRQTAARRQEALLQYEAAIQNALREVDDALINEQKIREHTAALERETKALREYTRLARLSYLNGYSGYFQVLYADQSLFVTELGYAQAQGERLVALITLYKVMGGGWVYRADELILHEP